MKKLQIATVIFLMVMICALLASCGTKIEVTFDPAGGDVVSGETTQIFSKKTNVQAPTLTRDGYRFDGWDKDFSAPAENMTVTALWTKLHTVTIDLDGGTFSDGSADSVIVPDGENCTVPDDPKRKYYSFAGWEGSFDSVSDDITIKALWKRVYIVRFELDGGTTSNSARLTQEIVDGDAAIAPEVKREKYIFKGWDKDFSEVHNDMVVTAQFERRELSSTEVYKLISPSTVEINTYRYDPNNVYSTGSGFFISTDGEILTNFHVVEDAYVIKVKIPSSNGTKEYAVTNILAYDTERDLVILKINKKDCVPLEFSDEAVNSGDVVYAIGSSLGLTDTFSSGIISSASRELNGYKYTFIQTTAPISSGNSGGPLVDRFGQVIGINTLASTNGQNLNFSIPISRVNELTRQTITVSSFFSLTGTKYYPGEHYVKENDTANKDTIQKLENCDTVQGTVAFKDVDVFWVNQNTVPVKDGEKRDMYIAITYMTNDANAVISMLESFGVCVCLNKGNGNIVPMYSIDVQIVEVGYDGGGYYVTICVEDIDNMILEYECIGVVVANLKEYKTINYELYIGIVRE